ncbi:TetR/AcrR family transcriptional regulator, partial [archaeon]
MTRCACAGSPSAGAGCTPAAGVADAATGLDDDAEEEPEEKVTK